MPARRPLIVGDEFVVGHRQQSQWNWLIVTAFLLGKIGSGLFLVSLLTQFPLGMLVGWVLGTAGKGAAHMAYLGKPARFWRAFAHPQSSWLSRGLWGMAAYTVFGLLTWVHFFASPDWIPFRDASTLWTGVAVLAVVSALVMMTYDGFAMVAARGMALWNAAALPVIAFFYALLGGVTFRVTLGVWSTANVETAFLESAELLLLALNCLLVATFFLTMFSLTERAKRAVQVLIHMYGWPFFIGVFVIGLMTTALLVLAFTATRNADLLAAVAISDVVGHYLLFYVLLKGGLFAPPLSRRAYA